jgi:hypothetical protein
MDTRKAYVAPVIAVEDELEMISLSSVMATNLLVEAGTQTRPPRPTA